MFFRYHFLSTELDPAATVGVPPPPPPTVAEGVAPLLAVESPVVPVPVFALSPFFSPPRTPFPPLPPVRGTKPAPGVKSPEDPLARPLPPRPPLAPPLPSPPRPPRPAGVPSAPNTPPTAAPAASPFVVPLPFSPVALESAPEEGIGTTTAVPATSVATTPGAGDPVLEANAEPARGPRGLRATDAGREGIVVGVVASPVSPVTVAVAVVVSPVLGTTARGGSFFSEEVREAVAGLLADRPSSPVTPPVPVPLGAAFVPFCHVVLFLKRGGPVADVDRFSNRLL